MENVGLTFAQVSSKAHREGVGLRVVDFHTGNHPEGGFTPFETIRRDMGKMFQLANLHETLDLYIGQIPQAKKDVSTMSLEELIAWEQEETQSPSYLRSPHV
ncbi:hypothetical protein Tco_1151093 [Tanacetum coccineum]